MPKFAVFLFGLLIFLKLGSTACAGDDRIIPSTGGEFFHRRIEIPVPAFAQDDARWSAVRLGTSSDTLGVEGCAVTSAAMVLAFYGIKIDPQILNAFLTRTGGLDHEGLIDWSQVQLFAPSHLKLVYDGAPSYDLIDTNLRAGNPVIAVIPLPNGAYHFVVIVGKEGQNYLIRDPAASTSRPAYPLRHLAAGIRGLCFFRALPAE